MGEIMGRKVQVRISYQADARSLMRLIEAIEVDPHRSLSWKRKASRLARELATMLVKIPSSLAKSTG